MSEPRHPSQPPSSTRQPYRPSPPRTEAAPARPIKFAEGSAGTSQPPAPRRRAVPEPPRRQPSPAPEQANVIPITRARTTPPHAGFNTIADGWSIPARKSTPASAPQSVTRAASPIVAHTSPAVAHAAPVVTRAASPGVATSAAARVLPLPADPPAPHDTIVMKDPFAAFVPAPVAPPPAPEISDKERWAVFEQLGLGPKAKPVTNHKQMIINTYRGLGFVVLSIIVVVLVGYIATSAFYFVSDSWVQPMVVSKSDEKVLTLQSQVTAQLNERDRILAELNQADRNIAVQQTFQAEFAEAIRADLSGRKAALTRMRQIANSYGSARAKIRKSNSAFASSSRRKMQQQYAAGLIDRNDMLSGKYQLAQITTSNLGLAERQAEYENRAEDLEQQADALDAIINQKSGEGGAISYDVLKIKQEFEMSRLETAKAIENREALKAALTRQDAIIEGLRKSPYLRAIEDGANVAFVPYGNMDNVEVGAPLYGCALEMVFCHKVGKVKEVLPGEVSFKHPHREKAVRGQMIEVELSDKGSGEEDVLFVGGRPLLL